MKKQLPTILLGIACIALLAAFLYANRTIGQLKQQIAAAESRSPMAGPTDSGAATATAQEQVAVPSRTQTPERMAAVTAPQPVVQPDEPPARRMMESIAKMMDNPTMNQVLEASQRGTISALYADFIDYLGLNPEESEYFMDLLMHRQMAAVDYAMKAMAGNLDPESLAALQAEVEEANRMVEKEMEYFLNDPDDFAEFKYYEDTTNERMMLSQLDEDLAGTEMALSDETYRDLLGMMHEERNSFQFSTDLAEGDNLDLSPERISRENIQLLAEDLRTLNNNIIDGARNILTPDQLAAFEKSMDSNMELQLSQLEMAAQLFGGNQ
jgi:hypothetical protein